MSGTAVDVPRQTLYRHVDPCGTLPMGGSSISDCPHYWGKFTLLRLLFRGHPFLGAFGPHCGLSRSGGQALFPCLWRRLRRLFFGGCLRTRHGLLGCRLRGCLHRWRGLPGVWLRRWPLALRLRLAGGSRLLPSRLTLPLARGLASRLGRCRAGSGRLRLL